LFFYLLFNLSFFHPFSSCFFVSKSTLIFCPNPLNYFVQFTLDLSSKSLELFHPNSPWSFIQIPWIILSIHPWSFVQISCPIYPWSFIHIPWIILSNSPLIFRPNPLNYFVQFTLDLLSKSLELFHLNPPWSFIQIPCPIHSWYFIPFHLNFSSPLISCSSSTLHFLLFFYCFWFFLHIPIKKIRLCISMSLSIYFFYLINKIYDL
jgi:hypothetical protein